MPPRVRVNAAAGPAAEAAGVSARELRSALERAASHTLRAEGQLAGELSVTLLDDAAIQALNARWLGHERPTDVLAFALHAEGEAPLGDVYIGFAEAARQAGEHGVAPFQELVRLTVHGTLHVLGWDHAEGAERVGGDMWRRQEALVAELFGG